MPNLQQIPKARVSKDMIVPMDFCELERKALAHLHPGSVVNQLVIQRDKLKLGNLQFDPALLMINHQR